MAQTQSETLTRRDALATGAALLGATTFGTMALSADEPKSRRKVRIGVVGGGCSGFQYSMAFENQPGMMDKVFTFDDLKVFVDATSLMYLNGCVVDYVETLEAAGFKFENPQVKSTCGCGSSFSV